MYRVFSTFCFIQLYNWVFSFESFSRQIMFSLLEICFLLLDSFFKRSRAARILRDDWFETQPLYLIQLSRTACGILPKMWTRLNSQPCSSIFVIYSMMYLFIIPVYVWFRSLHEDMHVLVWLTLTPNAHCHFYMSNIL